MNYIIDKLISQSKNKYDLSEAIALKAKDLKNNEDITLGYEAINIAITEYYDSLNKEDEEEEL